MNTTRHPVALITGASRGIGAATAFAFAEHGHDTAITYHNKAVRAQEVANKITGMGTRALTVGCDITEAADLQRLFAELHEWSSSLDILVLNAAGGLERDTANDPEYPMRINRDAQLALVDGALPLMSQGGVVLFITSHWAHMHGKTVYPPAYVPVATTKYAGEHALRARQSELAARGIRLLVVTGDVILGTITAKLMERSAPGVIELRRQSSGRELPTTTEMANAIVTAAMDPALPSGSTITVGGNLDTLGTLS